MKKILIFPVLLIILAARGQSDWKQSLRYHLHVKFNPAEKSLDALMKLIYTNHSPDTLTFIWFHVWPNAYRNDRTLYSEQMLENGDTRFYFSSKEQKGYLNRLDFRVDGNLARMQDHPEYLDVIKLILPEPLLPGDSIIITSSFHLRLPFNFNGNGYSAHRVEMRNWYPEPAVYDVHGWHPLPFLAQGGAYHEAADFTVEIEAPPTYRIAAGAKADTVSRSNSVNQYRFTLHHANAFAWIADTRFQVKEDSLQFQSGRVVGLQYFYIPSRGNDPDKPLSIAKKEIRQLSEWLTVWPFPNISLVQAAPMEDQNFTGLACLGSNPGNDWQQTLRKSLSGLWFQTILMTNQRDIPWFSKGFIRYYTQRLLNQQPPLNPEKYPYAHHDLWLRIAEQEKQHNPSAGLPPNSAQRTIP